MNYSNRKGAGFRPKRMSAALAGGLLTTTMGGMVITTTPAKAADASAGLALEEIIVTARKREESIQTTPVAVTAFTQESLEVRNVSSIEAIAQYVPNLQFDGAAALSGGSFNATVFIRGIGQNDFATFSDTGVGIYVDG